VRRRGRGRPGEDRSPPAIGLELVVAGERRIKPGLLLGGEQVRAGVQRAAGPVERIAGVAAVAVQRLLDAAPAAVERVTGQPDHVEGIHDRGCVGQFLGGGGLEAGVIPSSG